MTGIFALVKSGSKAKRMDSAGRKVKGRGASDVKAQVYSRVQPMLFGSCRRNEKSILVRYNHCCMADYLSPTLVAPIFFTAISFISLLFLMEGALLGTAMNAGFAGIGDELGLPYSASSNISSMVQKIIRSNMTMKQKQEAIKKIKQQQQMRGMVTNQPMRRAA